MYNVTALEDATTLFDQVAAINVLSNNLFGIVALLSTFVILLFVIKTNDFKKTMIVDSFICSVLAVLMYVMHWVAANVFILPILLLSASIIVYLFMND